jgi:hypothetical protein
MRHNPATLDDREPVPFGYCVLVRMLKCLVVSATAGVAIGILLAPLVETAGWWTPDPTFTCLQYFIVIGFLTGWLVGFFVGLIASPRDLDRIGMPGMERDPPPQD